MRKRSMPSIDLSAVEASNEMHKMCNLTPGVTNVGRNSHKVIQAPYIEPSPIKSRKSRSPIKREPTRY